MPPKKLRVCDSDKIVAADQFNQNFTLLERTRNTAEEARGAAEDNMNKPHHTLLDLIK